MSKYNWTRQETKDLITLYEINECLWHKGLREYKDRDERISSIQSISDEMKIPIEEINKKIHNLRNQYRFELNKTKRWGNRLDLIIWKEKSLNWASKLPKTFKGAGKRQKL